MLGREIYVQRREVLKKKLGKGVVILPGNNESPRNYKDNCYSFDQDSTFLYYFGMDIPSLVGVIDIDNNKEYIFGTDFTLDDIVWMGEQKLLKSYAEEAGVENFIEMSEFEKFAAQLKADKREFLLIPQYKADNVMKLSKALGLDPFKYDEHTSLDLIKAIIEQRNVKSQVEIDELEKAVNITKEMHLTAMKTVKAGMKEYEVVAAIEAVAKKYYGSTSFFTIFTKNGHILHNHGYDNTVEDGDMIVLDCGAKSREGYCGDMTTAFPVNGKYSDKQKDMYSLLIEMFEKAEEMVRPGINYKDVHLAVAKVLTEGMIKRGLMKGNADEAVKAGAHAVFFPHGLGHMLGLDVHDMENLGEDLVGYESFPRDMQFGLKSLRLARVLKEGYVFTIEPGIYFIPELVKRWKAAGKFMEYLNYEKIEEYFGFGGMRYEGDFVITADGARRLGDKMPKYYNEIEEIMKK